MIKINLIREPSSRLALPRKTRPELMGALIFLVTAAIMGSVYWFLIQERTVLQAQRQDLQQQSLELRAARAELERYRDQKEQLDARISVIEQLKDNQKGPVRMMNSIIESVPSDPRLWLTSLGQRGTTVTIEGQAFDVPAIADFITSLNEKDSFKYVELEYWEEDATSLNFKLNCEVEN